MGSLNTMQYLQGEYRCRHFDLQHLRPPRRPSRYLPALRHTHCIGAGFGRVYIVYSRHVQFSTSLDQPLPIQFTAQLVISVRTCLYASGPLI